MCELAGGHWLKPLAASPVVGSANQCGADPAIFETHGHYGVENIKLPVPDAVFDVSDRAVFMNFEAVGLWFVNGFIAVHCSKI